MSVSVYIKGIIPADAEYRKNFAAWKACHAADVDPPKEIKERLGIVFDEVSDPAGAEVEIRVVGDVESGNGAIVDLTTLPKGVTKLRVFMR